MAIDPLDMQVLFSKSIEVGREQAIANSAAQVAQTVEAGELVQRTEVENTSVNESKETGEVGPVGGKGAGGRRRKPRQGGSPIVPKREDEVRDPRLGNHVDITG